MWDDEPCEMQRSFGVTDKVFDTTGMAKLLKGPEIKETAKSIRERIYSITKYKQEGKTHSAIVGNMC